MLDGHPIFTENVKATTNHVCTDPMEINSVNSQLHTLVRAEKLQLLFVQSYPAIFVSLITAAVLTVILWPVQAHSVLVSWYVILTIAAVGRYILFLRYRSASPKGEEILDWERPYFVTLMLTTLTWGVVSIAIIPSDSPIHQVIVLCFMIGLSGGAISLYSAHRRMTSLTIATLLMPVMLWFLLRGDLLSLELVAGTGVFFVSAIRATRFIASALHQNFMLSHELRASKEKYQSLVDDVGDKFAMYSHHPHTGELLYVTGGIQSIFGISKHEAIGKSWHTVINWKKEDFDDAGQLLRRADRSMYIA